MQIDVWIAYNGKEIDAEAILDSGAEGVYCNTSFIKKYPLPTYDIELPVYPRNINGTLNWHVAMQRSDQAYQLFT